MEMGLREWLAIIGVIVILAIILDGFRRYFGRSTLKFKLDRNLINQFARETDSLDIQGPARATEPAEPVLGEPVHDLEERPRQRPEKPGRHARKERPQPAAEPVEAAPEQLQIDTGPAVDESVLSASREDRVPMSGAQVEEGYPEQSEPAVEPAQAEQLEQAPVQDSPQIDPEIFALFVETGDEEGLKGSDLLQSVLESGMRYGDMDIFHRHESMSGTGEKLYSMANSRNPGTFDLDNIEGFSTQSVCFFMALPGPKQPKQAFELMLSAARKLADELGGELKDDHRSNLTGQTIEHYRQRIVDFERRQLSLRI